MSIDLCSYDGTVAQYLLDIPDVHILLQQQGGEGMPEHVRRDMLRQFGHIRIPVDHIADRLVGQAVVEAVYEEIFVVFNLVMIDVHIIFQSVQDL